MLSTSFALLDAFDPRWREMDRRPGSTTEAGGELEEPVVGLGLADGHSGALAGERAHDHFVRQAVFVERGGALTERKAMGLDSRIMTKSGKRPNLYYTTEGIKLDLLDSLAAKRRYEGEVMSIKGGYEGLNLNGRVVLTCCGAYALSRRRLMLAAEGLRALSLLATCCSTGAHGNRDVRSGRQRALGCAYEPW